MNFSTILLFIAALLMLAVTGLTRYQMTAKVAAAEAGTVYEFKTKGGLKTLQGPELERTIARESVWTLMFGGLIGLLLLCAGLAIKWELPAAIAAAVATLLVHVYLYGQLGFAEYRDLNGLVFTASVLPLVPVAYVYYMRSLQPPKS